MGWLCGPICNFIVTADLSIYWRERGHPHHDCVSGFVMCVVFFIFDSPVGVIGSLDGGSRCGGLEMPVFLKDLPAAPP